MINCFMYVVYQNDILYLFGMANISFVNFIFPNYPKYFYKFQAIKVFKGEIFKNLSHNERI